jgi:hypothetical protein
MREVSTTQAPCFAGKWSLPEMRRNRGAPSGSLCSLQESETNHRHCPISLPGVPQVPPIDRKGAKEMAHGTVCGLRETTLCRTGNP